MALLAAAALIAAAAHISIMAAGERPAGLFGTLGSIIVRLPGQIRRADPAAPDFVAGIYGGYSATADSDVRLQQPGGTDLTIKDVHWGSEPDEMPPYHGFRGTWWLPFGRSLGLTGDLVYVKVVADRERTVSQSGTRDGEPVPESEPLSATFRRLEFTDGLNLATVNAVYRLPFPGRVRPYIGIGAGASLPHAEVRRTSAPQRTFEFQLAGYVVQVFAGIEFRLASRGSIFTEYRASYATNDVRLVDGGTLQTNLFVNHFSAGGLGHLRPAAAAAR
jgi:lipid A oxidase